MKFSELFRTASQKAVLGLAASVALGAFAPAHAATFGRTTVGTIPTAGLVDDFKRGSKYTLTEPGTITTLHAYFDGKGTPGEYGFQWVHMALYQDAGGTPGTKVLETQELYVPVQSSGLWASFPTPQVPLQPGNYWMVIHSGESAARARDYGDGASNWYGKSDTFSDGASEAFGPGNAGTVTLSVYGNYTTP